MKDAAYWKRQSRLFNLAANYYNTYRPSYPQATIDHILTYTPGRHGRLLEIGAGSGKATQQFTDQGYHITCVEPGQDLARIGQETLKDRVTYFVSTFEDYTSQDQFDLIYSAQAFHWVSQPQGYEKCSEHLVDQGYLAVFWNYYLHNSTLFDDDLSKLFDQYGLGYLQNKDDHLSRVEKMTQEMMDSGYFKKPIVTKDYWSQTYDYEDYIGFIKTGNGYLDLSQSEKEMVEEKIKDLFTKHKIETLVRPFVCVSYIAQKK